MSSWGSLACSLYSTPAEEKITEGQFQIDLWETLELKWSETVPVKVLSVNREKLCLCVSKGQQRDFLWSMLNLLRAIYNSSHHRMAQQSFLWNNCVFCSSLLLLWQQLISKEILAILVYLWHFLKCNPTSSTGKNRLIKGKGVLLESKKGQL